LLVDVKNVAPKDCTKPAKLRRRDVLAYQCYAGMTGARLVFAHYWSGPKLWTLVDAAALEEDGERFLLPITAAMLANELGTLGDAMIGTTPPLTFTLYADPTGLQKNRPTAEDDTRLFGFTIARAEFAAAGRVLTDRVQKRIAQVLTFLGDWEVSAEADIVDNRVVNAVFTAEPAVPDDEYAAQIAAQGFATVGMLSTMYSRWFELATLNRHGLGAASFVEEDGHHHVEALPARGS
jgi:hypothetical protein